MRVDEIQILAADVLLPPPDLTVSQWADQNARLSSEFAAEKGEWRTDRAPYQRAVMDAMGPSSPYETVVMMCLTREAGASTGWSQGALIYWNNTTKVITKTATSNKLIGVAVRAAADGDATGRVRLNGAFIS